MGNRRKNFNFLYSPGIIIKQGKEKDFIKKMNENRLDIYKIIDDNETIRRNCTKEAIDEINKLMDMKD